VVASTVVDGDSLGSVFYFHSQEDTTSLLSGLTIFSGLGTIPYNEKGGGVSCDSSSPTIEYCSIIGNVAYEGAGIYCLNYSSPKISNNTIKDNTALGYGGGISCGWYSSAEIANNIITSCLAGEDGGGAINCWRWSPSITNNILEGCSAGLRGGGISCFDASPTIINNTIVDNSAVSYGGGILFYRSPSILINTIVWDNNAPVGPALYVQTGNNPTVTYSNIENGWPGIGNIDADPLFVTGRLGNYYLSQIAAGQPEQSPCVDSGDPGSMMVAGTTRTDEVVDEWPVDMGYHYPSEPVEPDIYLYVTPMGPTTVSKGEELYFHTYIWNNTNRTVAGNYWLSVLLPDSIEVFIPEMLLNYSNPLSGQILPFDAVDLDNWLFIPTQADTGSYELIGRIGVYPNTIIDEESFGFRVVE
jgi:hypothetical protein